jgi:catalase
MRLGRRIRVTFVVLLLLAAFAFWRITRDPPPGPQGEYQQPGEDAVTARLVASSVALIEGAQKPDEVTHRDVHAKPHGCVKAKLTVGDAPAAFRIGLFAENKEYKAWIRFSSGDTRRQADGTWDARGFALKVMGVPGEKLLENEKDEDTQDFVMINSRVFFVPTVQQYAEFMARIGDGDRYGYFFGGGSPNPWRWHPRQFWLALTTLKPAPTSLLTTQFHSLSSYAFGTGPGARYVKYSARPCEGLKVPRSPRDGENFLREGLKAALTSVDGCFDFLVQPQVAGKNMPVEDPTVEWREKDSPFVKVARIVIPRQAFDSPEQNAFCEDLSFTPWHALPEHRPVGGANRMRKAVYQEISRYRHAKNGKPRAEPKGWCLDVTGASCPPDPS